MLLLPAVNNLTLNWEEALPTQAPVKTAKKKKAKAPCALEVFRAYVSVTVQLRELKTRRGTLLF